MCKCNICLESDPLEFYESNKSNCKQCLRLRSRKHRDDNIEKVKEYDRNRPNAKERNEAAKERYERQMKTEEGRKRSRIRSVAWIEKNHIKRAAHIIFGNARRDGKVTAKPCEICGDIKVDGHHDDYEKPLDVRWLCRKHHAEHHKQEREKARNNNENERI